LTLGDRADGDKVRVGCERADIHASFEVSALPFAQKWLNENDLAVGEECILRRVVTKEGRSRSYINGQTVPLLQLRTLGEMLIDIHNQHEHQSLLKVSTHRRLLDDSAGLQTLTVKVKEAFAHWHKLSEQLQTLKTQNSELNARFQLLSYQVSELDQLNLQEGELETLEQEQRMLANVDEVQNNCQHIVTLCDGEDDGIKDRLIRAIRLISDIGDKPEHLKDVETLLRNAAINIDEAQADIERYLGSNEQNPEKLQEIEARLSAIYDIARRHRTTPEQLTVLHCQLAEELSSLQSGDELLEKIEEEIAEKLKIYDELSQDLSTKRYKAAAKLTKAVNQKLHDLAMEKAQLSLTLTHLDSPALYGNEKIEFLISTMPGQAPLPLHKVASGGELSRISLAIQVVTAQTSTSPTLVFDEVDVGIGGATGNVVGAMLRELGARGQIFCVTHLAQVASKAHHHLRVEKQIGKKGASSSLTVLDGEDKILEIARMMGGAIDSAQSIAHAREMVNPKQLAS
ncbi:MAG: DNA repair protein RecN (Recombination protein N), partial [Lentisphaeria bacterium]